jgi:hypothetical protein
MRAARFSLASPILFLALLTVFSFFAAGGRASASDDSPFTTLDAAACEKLDDKNLHVGPPDAEIVEACDALRRSAVFSQRFSGGPPALALALFGMVLVYAAFGVPMRAMAGLMGRFGGRTIGALTIDAVLGVILRGAIGLLFVAILSLPYAMTVGCVVVVALLILQLRSSRVAPALPATETAAAPPSLVSVVLADLTNDAAASAAGLLGLALLARRDLWLLAFGVALVVAASLPAVIAARRRLRRRHVLLLAVAGVLGAIFGVAADADPYLPPTFAQSALASLVLALAFATAVVGSNWLGRRGPETNAASG